MLSGYRATNLLVGDVRRCGVRFGVVNRKSRDFFKFIP